MALVYSDMFDFPLTKKEMLLWQIRLPTAELKNNKKRVEKLVKFNRGFYFLKGRERLVKLRKNRRKISQEKMELTSAIVEELKRIPTIEAIYLTGSLSVMNAKEGADLDLFIVCKPGMMWLTRLAVVIFLKTAGIYREGLGGGKFRNRICTNIFLDRTQLTVKAKSLYSAHEVLQAKLLFDRGNIGQIWLLKNRWVGECLPEMYQYQMSKSVKRIENLTVMDFTDLIIYILALPGEILAFTLQYSYMRNKISKEKVGWGYAYFHPKDLNEMIEGKFFQKLSSLGVC